jgi:hypothetical protein
MTGCRNVKSALCCIARLPFMFEKYQHNRRPAWMTSVKLVNGALLEGFERFVLVAMADEAFLIRSDGSPQLSDANCLPCAGGSG